MHLVAHSLPETTQRCKFYQFALFLRMVEMKLQVFLLLARKTCTFWEVYFLIPAFS